MNTRAALTLLQVATYVIAIDAFVWFVTWLLRAMV